MRINVYVWVRINVYVWVRINVCVWVRINGVSDENQRVWLMSNCYPP